MTSRRETRSLLSPLIIIALLCFAFIFDNHRKTIPHLKFIHLPVEIRLFDSVLLLGTSAFILINRKVLGKKALKNPELHNIFFSILAMGLASIIFNGMIKGNITDKAYFEGLMKYCRPLFVIFIVSNLYRVGISLTKAIKILIGIGILNATIAWFLIISGARGDGVDGLMRSAHALANFLFLMTLTTFAYIWYTQRRKLVLLLPYFLVPAIIASHIRSTLVFSITILIYAIIKLTKSPVRHNLPKVLKYLVGSTVILILIGSVVYRYDPKLIVKISELTEDLAKSEDPTEKIGFIHGYLSLPKVYESYPLAILLGKGPGQFGSGVSYFSYGGNLYNSPMYHETIRFFGQDIRSIYSGSLNVLTTSVFAVLVEYGLIVSLLFILYFKRLVRHIHKHTPVKMHWGIIFTDLYLIYVLIFSTIGTGCGWENMLTMLPFSVILGFVVRASNTHISTQQYNHLKLIKAN